MDNGITIPETLQQAILLYADEDKCLELLIAARWPDGVIVCPYCSGTAIGFVRSRRIFQCKAKECRKQFSIKTGSYMEDSPLKLSTWLPCMWLITNAKNGVSSHEVARALGITQKTAWFLLHRIRMSFGDGMPTRLSGTVEADETYLGGNEKNKHKDKRSDAIGRRAGDKAIVYGLLQRGDGVQHSKATVKVVPNAGKGSLQGPIRQHVAPGTEVYTDQWAGYKGLPTEYIHAYVDHSVEYVKGMVHTNGMENFFSLLKRMVRGTYVQVSPWHLQRYVEEQTFRFNERGRNDAGRFVQTIAGVHGKRLTWKQLTFPSWAFEGGTEEGQ